MHVQCAAQKFGLIFKVGPKNLGLKGGHIKPTTVPVAEMPAPPPLLNKGDYSSDIGSDKINLDEFGTDIHPQHSCSNKSRQDNKAVDTSELNT